jgi:hypothetical protein
LTQPKPSDTPDPAAEAGIRGRKYMAKIGSGTMSEVWIRGEVAEHSRVEWRPIGNTTWRAGVCYDVALDAPCQVKLTHGSQPPAPEI